jgi:GNAT superfamily N-acetyltransferase
MSFEFQRVDPAEVREEVVDFFWKHKRWSAETRDEYYTLWDWRHSALSEGPPFAYIARLKATGEVVGHLGIYRRTFRAGDALINGCVPGNLFVHPDWQKNIIGVRLVMFLRSLIQTREFDLFLGFGNKSANAMLERLGFAQLGVMRTYVDVRDAGPVLRRRNRALAPVGPIVNLGFAARRRWSRALSGKSFDLEVKKLDGQQFLKLDRSHWAPPDRLVAWESNRFVVERYLNEPDTARDLFGLFDPVRQSLEAFVVTEPTARAKVWNCQTNPATVDPASAISIVFEEIRDAETVLVPTLPQSELAEEFVRAGFLDRESVDAVEAGTYVSAYSLPDNQHAGVLGDHKRWNLWMGSRHY